MIPAPNGPHHSGQVKFCPSCGAPAGSECKVAAPRGRGFCADCGEPIRFVQDDRYGYAMGMWQHESDGSPVFRCPMFRPKEVSQ